MKQKSVIIIDDDIAMREMMIDYLEGEKYQVKSYDLASRAFSEIQELTEEELGLIDCIVTDLMMPEMDGLEFVARMKKFAPDIPIVIVTAFASIDTAIQATKQGAFSYLSKPFKLIEFEVNVEKAVNLRNLKRENGHLKTAVQGQWRFGKIIGKSRMMREVYELIERVAGANATVLVTGESGTGKELVARAIHDKGPRKHKPFVAINCTAIPDALLESELFGHIKGSFTGAITNKVGLFAEADGGTIFLDEIGDLDMSLQAKILRVLQEKKIKPVGANQERTVDVRVIAATHKDLKQAIVDGNFREDLYYRLSVLPLHIPPLRQRREDIPLLANYFLEKYIAVNHSQSKSFSPDAMKYLIGADWDGNVRELENLVERMVVLCKGIVIEEHHLPKVEETKSEDFFAMATHDWPTLEELSQRYMQVVLQKTGGRKEKAANILGINRRTLYRKGKELGTEGGLSDAHEQH